MPSPRRRLELVLALTATLSTMAVFALGRANIDILAFMLVLAAGLFAECKLAMRLLGYFTALLSALLKYYPITSLIVAFRERMSIFVTIVLIVMGTLAVFWAEYHVEIARGLPNIARGQYNTDPFGVKNLPVPLGEAVGKAAEPSSLAPLVGRAAAGGPMQRGSVAALPSAEGGWASASCVPPSPRSPRLERIFLVIGGGAITGCFFAGQGIGYRSIFLLLVLPGLAAISREPSRDVRKMSLATGLAIVLLMWGECLRHALYSALERPGVLQIVVANLKILFWFIGEHGWWWAVSVMLAVLADFLWDSPTARTVSSLFDRLVAPRFLGARLRLRQLSYFRGPAHFRSRFSSLVVGQPSLVLRIATQRSLMG